MDDEERLEGEEEMELDDASDGEDEDEEPIGMSILPATSEQLFTGVPVTPGNVTPEEPYDPLRYQKFPLPGGKPLGIRRGPGRPRKERPPGTSMRGLGTRRPFGRGSNRGKGLYSRGGIRRTKSKDDDTHSESQSPLRLIDDPSGEGESSGMDRSMPAPEEPPYVPEKYPGKACALCNLGERSQLGQGELVQFTCPVGFTPEKNINRDETPDLLADVSSTGDKSPRGVGVGPGAVTCRRQKSLAKCRNPSLTNFTEPVEELTIVGYAEEPDVALLFETAGIYYVHKSCAIWSSNSKEIISESLSPAIVQASSRRCAYCSHYGAGIPCKVGSCNRYFHFPCAAASSSFQDTKTLSLYCSQHLGQVPLLLNGDITCMTCYGMGDVSNLVMCTVCNQHYHGSCLGKALLPGVRAGWQCDNCKVCQVCRQHEDATKVMLCEQCDKAYHPGCLRPIVTSIPKIGWKCKCCRVCTDCGSRTPGAGLSSRWHSHYTVCDSCYQQRNKGFSCPLCRKAYRAAAYREMVQCSCCKKFVHGTCDPEADPLTYQHRKEAKPDYEYICTNCKKAAFTKRSDNIDDYGGDSSLTASQESLYGDGDSSEFDYPADDPLYSIGLGKGKPYCASKIAKKRMGLAGLVGRPKGIGKVAYQKRQKLNEFGRKRGPKAKMRGIFGVPGVGLQKPQSDSSKEDEPGVENRLVLCSAKDKFVLTQDICVMCGAIGTDSEGCLIACAQCGQCYHPYCANVKVTKVILQNGWRCLDCTVCEGCGERHDEGRLILCDDCDISYHIYCMDPPLDYVPHGTWKCNRCAQCQTCGSNDPGFNSSWQRNYTQCGPCASHSACASCQEPYNEGDLIIQCVQCERWLHCACDHIKTEADAEKCAEEGYNCILCRPRDVPPPHLLCNLPKPQLAKFPRSPPPMVRSPELYKPSTQQYLVDGVYLSEAGMHHIKSLTFEQQQTRKKRRKMLPVIDKDADIMATIESVVAGSLDNSLEEHGKLDMDIKDEPNEVYKEGMVWPHSDQPPPEGYSLYTTENGISVLRRKRQRNLQKLGIGGFVVRLRGTRKDKEHEGEAPEKPEGSSMSMVDDKPRKKVQRKKQQPKLAESFPLYMQEAFFGKDLMDITKDRDLKSSSDSDSEKNISGNADTIQLSQDEIKAIEQVNTKNAKEREEESKPNDAPVKTEEPMEEDTSDTEALGDILPISTDLLDTDDLVNTLMNDEEDLAKASEALDDLEDGPGPSRDELTDILSPHFNLESMVRDTGLPNMDSKDVEEIFKGVLTDESQESQESSSVFPMQAQPPRTPSTTTPLVSPSPHPNIPTGIPLGRPQVPVTLPPVAQSNLNSPMSFPPPSPYHSEYSNSPQFSPAFSEPPSPWVNPDEEGPVGVPGVAATGKQGNNVKMFQDEKLGAEATISSVLYANLMHPEWKEEYPSWPERCKQILKKWRALPNETKAPYLTQARDNRATIRMKKTQQISKDIPSTIQVTTSSSSTVLTKPVTASQINPIVGLGTSQKQIGLLTSVVSDKLAEKQGLQGTSVAVSAGQTINLQQQQQQQPHQQPQQQQQVAVAHISQGNQLVEVCAVQGPPRQLTTISSPSPSPTSSTSSSPRPNSVNSMTNYVVNVATTTATINQDSNSVVAVKLTQSPATLITNVVTAQCNNAAVVIGQQATNQLTLQQQRSNNNNNNNTTNHITISTSTISNQTLVSNNTNNSNSNNNNNQASNAGANVTSGTIVVAGTVRQFTTVDHQIRVLTPSEIMRTLPSLSQEHYDPPPTAIIHTVPVQNHPAMEQERLSNRDRSTKEAEQERQWKQLQALRQQQAQLQAQVIHEQRTHAITARVHRQLSDDGSQMISDTNTGLTTQLQVATSQDGTQLGAMASPSPGGTRGTFAAPPLKVNRAPQSPHPGMPRLPNQQVTRPVGQVVRAGMPNTFTQPPSPFSPQAPQSPHDFPQSPASSQSQEHFQRFDNSDGFNQGNQTPRPMMSGTPTYQTSPRNDVFTQPPGTPRPIFNPPTPRTSTHVYAPSRTPDPYSNQPPTPSPAPSYASPRPESRQEPPQQEVFNQQPEVNRQLRDLLQRQQFKKMEQIPGNWSQDGQNSAPETVQQQQFDQQGHVQMQQPQQHVQQTPNTVEGTFRHPLPPGMRPRVPIQLNLLVRNPQGNLDGRLQGIDPRARMILQRPQGIPQPPQQPQHFQNQPQQNPQQVLQQQHQSQQQSRMPAPRNPMAEQYDLLQQTPQVPQNQQIQGQQQPPRFPDPQQHNQPMQRIIRGGPDMNPNVRMMSPSQALSRPPLIPTTVNENPPASESSEIPDNVTAELEKLEQEGAPMVEVEGVSAILGDLAEDDDELLAEMGADFNILEYADPELDNITGGEKTNILDMDLEQVEVEPKEDKLKKESKVEEHKTEDLGGTTTAHDMNQTNVPVPASVGTAPPSIQSTPVPVQQIPATSQPQVPQQPPNPTMIQQNHPQAVALQQQMNNHVQQAAAMGRPMMPGTRLVSPDGAVGVVTSSNTVTLSYPSNFPGHPQRIPQQHMQLQQQRLGMRVPGVQGVPGRVVSVGHMIGPRMPLAPPPPPPPPYPGPPPPYPGPVQMGLCGGRGMPRPPVHIGHQMSVPGPPMAPVVHTGSPSVVPHQHRRPLLLQEQPLLLEDLLEQEKREQEKQQKQQQVEAATVPAGALLSDSDFEMLRADVIGSSALGSPPQGIVSGPATRPMIRPPGKPRPPSAPGTPWPQVPDAVKLPVQNPRQPIATQTPAETRVATFNIPHLPAPPVPPEVIVTDQDRLMQMQYEQWLQHQGQILKQQQIYYDTEVQKLRKLRKSLNSKQRQLRKTGGELTENDAIELQRISNEQAILQKQLDASRKQVRQHNMLTQEYQSKQQARQNQAQAAEACSPLMSPSQHSPMHSPAGLVSHSPGPGSTGMIQHSPATSMIQNSPNAQMLQHSPSNPQQANPGTMSPHNMQQSPRIGTPHSQGEESPFSPGAMPSPGMCGPTTRMASPQHRAVMNSRLVTSPGSFQTDGRGNQQMMGDQAIRLQNIHQRFVRPPNVNELGQRPRMQMQGGIIYNQRSPLGSPQPQQQMLTQQQMIQRQIQQHQQQQQLQQQQQQQMQKPPSSPMVSQPANSPSPQLHQQMQQSYGQPPSSPMPRSPMVQQTMGSPMLQQQLSQNSQPPSPMGSRIHHPPTSPMVSQYQPNPPSPMARSIPSTSPMLQHQLNNQHHPPPSQTPSSPMPRSPMVANSPMQIQRRQSNGNSPAMPDRPQSVENPGTPRTPHTPHYQQAAHPIDQQQSQQHQQEQPNQSDMNRGGGNPHNPLNPLPIRSNFGRFGFIKLGLRGGSPMWSTKPESSKGKTEPKVPTNSEDKPNTSAVHRKTGISQSKINSLVCADYNDFDDDSHTPPQTPPNRTDSKVQGSVSSDKSSALSLGSPSDKLDAMPMDTTDYDDDKTIINEEVTLSSTAQRDSDDTAITMIGDFEEGGINDGGINVVLDGLDPDMQQYVLFEQEIGDYAGDSNDSLSHALTTSTNQDHDLVDILEFQETHSVAGLSDDELLPIQSRNKKNLRVDIMRTLQTGKRFVTDTPESPDQEEIIDHSPGNSLFLDHGTDHNFMALVDSQVVIIDPDAKSPEDHLSKESCGEEEPERIDCNSIEPSQKVPDQVIQTSTPEPTDDKKSPVFNFSEKSQSPTHSAIVSSVNESVVSPEATGSSTVPEKITASPKAQSPEESIDNKAIVTSPEPENKKSPEVKISGKVSRPVVESSDTKEEMKINSIDDIDGSAESPVKIEEKIIETVEIVPGKNIAVTKTETEVVANSKYSGENEINTPKISPTEPEKSTIKSPEREPEERNSKSVTNSPASVANCTSSTTEILEEMNEEKKTDPLNTTDELESMLEAIHNPAEKTLNGENKKEKCEISPLQRISPVVDEISLVNILESDAEPIEKKDEQKDESDKSKEKESPETSSVSQLKEEPTSETKTFDAETEDSPEDLLDMLDNIISTKPEMVNTDILEEDRSRKSSLIYQLPTPLESLPLNILQDSLMDLETPGSEGEQSSQPEESPIRSQTPPKSTPATTERQSSSPPSSTVTAIAVTTVAQLQRSTTTVPHLSPLSQPTELTSNVVNVSHQLRSLLSSLHTNHSQGYTTAGQSNLVTMVSSVASGAKTSIVVTATGTMLMTSVSNTLNFTKPPVDTTTTFSNQMKEGSNTVSPLNKPPDQFNRISTGSVGSTLVSLPSSTTTARPGTNSGISITSNAMLNAMLSRTPAAKPSIAGHKASTILTQTTNLLPSALPNPIPPKPQNLQAMLAVTSAPILTKSAPNTSSTNSTVQPGKSVGPPMSANTINVTTSILQSTLSQAPTLLHSQLTSGSAQYKSTGLLPIDSKPSELDNLVQTSKEDENKPQARTEESPKIPTRMEESQNVLLKQLLQNTACATTAAASSTSTTTTLPVVPSLEAQLARPTSTPPSSLIPPLLSKIPTSKPVTAKQLLNRETSFVSQSPCMKTQSPPAKEEPPKATTPVTSVPPPLQTVQRPMEVVAKQQLQTKVPPTLVNQQMALKTAPPGVKLELTPQTEVTIPVNTAVVNVKPNVTNEPITSVAQMRVTNPPANFTRLIPTSKPLPQGQKMIPQSPQIINNIQTPSQPSTPVSTTPPQTPQPQIQGTQPPKPPTPIQIHQQQLAQQQLQQSRVQVVNTHQPPVPQKMPHLMGQHHAHLQQGPIVPQQLQTQQQPQPQPQHQQSTHTVPLVEVKKEILDEVLSGSVTANSDTKDFLTAKEEIMDGTIDDKTDLKKLKRRQYQQKRRQSQGKDANAQPQKKRARKVSRLDEDYDTFIDNLMIQLRQLPQMTVLEPLLGRNYGVCPIFGSGDLSKVGTQKDYHTRTGDLTGVYGVARLMGISDHYNTQPFGEQEPLPPQTPASTQRGFYDQEFPPLKLDDALDKKENMTRDIDTPDTIVSSSSPECVIPEFVSKFPGLRLIDDDSDEEADWLRRVSPVIPLISPIPIRLKPAHIKDNAKQDKENVGTTRLGKSPPVALRENGNVTVTLTLNSQAADDIMGVLKDLANILNIAPPNGYQIVERTTTPPSQKLGLYRTKGKDGKEGAPIDIQSILNGAAKFCRHCDVVILNSLIRKKVSDLPFLSKEEAEPGDELCFCSATCYMQFALMHRTPTTQGKAAAIVDHLSSKSDMKLVDSAVKKKLQEKRMIENKIVNLEAGEVEPMEVTQDVKIKTEKEDLDRMDIMDSSTEQRRPKKHPATEDLSGDANEPQPPAKLWKGLKYKIWQAGAIQPATKYKKPSDKEITELLFRLGVTVSPVKTDDTRRCMFCQNQGDGAADGPARLLNFDVDKWVHLNCALWSEDVYETVNGALINLDLALQHSLALNCIICEKPGATVKCFKNRCTNFYHLGCAVKDGCVFYKNKSTFCAQHAQKSEKDNELTTLAVYRRVYVARDENRQVASVMHHSDHNHLLRVGSLIFLSVGQLLPHQLAAFHTPNYIYPVGYKIVRFYWSMRRPNKRCRYVCSIHDVSGRPEFRVLVQEPCQEDVELRDATPRAVWSRILQPLAELRRTTNSVQLFPRYVSGEDLFGLTEPAIVRVLESLPGIETLTDYRPKYGRNPLLELPLAINPTGSARTEARCRNQLPWKRPHTQRTGSSARASTYAPASTAVAGEVACPYSKQFVHSKSSQYKKMKQDWRNNVYLARSKIQGLGLYAARDLEKHQMVIEYIGEIIRTELAETREKQYEARNRGIYMFRLDEERVVDATLCGGLARYINHSCNPNCVAEIVEVERDLRIIIFAKRRISRGEELAYDYKFDIEDDQHKIACACGAPNCRKWMN